MRSIRGNAVFLTLAVLFSFQCRKKSQDEGILAVIGDRVITADEFFRRAEYTVRPPYCRGDSPQTRSIVLNSLIAEKLYALEEGDSGALARSPAFQRYIQGRKEQFMRQILLEEATKGKTMPEDSEIRGRTSVAGREYRLSFFTVRRENVGALKDWGVNAVRPEFFNDLHERTGGLGPPPERIVSWKSPELPAVHKALFSGPLRKNQVIGPVDVGEDGYLMMRIIDWSDRPAVSEREMRERFDSVRRRLEEEKKQAVWDEFVFGLMKGRKLEFQRDPFEKMAELMRAIYMPTKNSRDLFRLDSLRTGEAPGRLPIDSILAEIRSNRMEGLPFFTFDGRTWTVSDFLKLTASHPLVFRKRRMRPGEFPGQFKLAVADLLRDATVNQEAYHRGMDRLPAVQRETIMWSDALLAAYHRHRVLKSRGKAADSAAGADRNPDRTLGAYTDSLFKANSNRIGINVGMLESIRLTRIDMVALNRDLPYIETVPVFPAFTARPRLDYGRRLDRPRADAASRRRSGGNP
ncbi:hypothetical protein JW777_09160 [bacterium]|nr:hypothetical protein [bacterium]